MAERRFGTSPTMCVQTNHRHGRDPASARSNQRFVRSDGRLHRRRGAAVQPRRGLGVPGRLLLLLRHSVDDRLRRLRTGNQPRRVGLAAEDGPLRAVSGVRAGPAGHVLRPDAGRGEKQVSKARTQAWPH